jgi:hypothetical protein
MPNADWRDLRPVLDEEIARLPEKYRAAFVLCYLEGRTNEEAAVQLGCPKGTILSRLSRGREWLRSRLTRRGVALTAASLTLTLSRNVASAAVPAALTRSTVNAAIPFAAGKTATELVSTTVAALTDGVLRTMILTKVKIAATALLSLAFIGTSITWAARGDGRSAAAPTTTDTAAFAARTPTPTAASPVAANEISPVLLENEPIEPQDRGNRGNDTPTNTGKVVSVGKDGKSFSIEMLAKVRGEEPGKLEIKITDKTAITYNSVRENGAKLTEGYLARVTLENGSKDIAAAVNFFGTDAGRQGPDLMGEVAGSTKDSITLIAAGPRGERGAEPIKETIPFDNKTVMVFGNVAAGQAKIADGYRTSVWLADDGKTAGKIQLIGMAGDVGRRDGKQPDFGGKVVAVGANGKSLTFESRGGRGEEPKKEEIKLEDKTSIIYNNVGTDGTKLTEGYQAQVWLADGSKDTAAKVVLTGTVPERWTTISGKVTEISAVGKDGITIVVEQPAANRGEEPTKTKITIPAIAKVSYSGVGPNEAKPTVGFDIQVRLKDNSNDTAASATFMKSGPRQEGGRRER